MKIADFHSRPVRWLTAHFPFCLSALSSKFTDTMITNASWPQCVGIAFNLRQLLVEEEAKNAKLLEVIAALRAQVPHRYGAESDDSD